MEVAKTDRPLVSVVITSYNRADMIGKAIQSALDQDYPNIEIIITDNCSTDNTNEVVSEYLVDERVKFFQNDENIGMIPNFKKGIEELSSGDYFVNLCSDDVLAYDGFISEAINLIKKYPDVTIVRGRNQSVNKDTGKVIPDDGTPFKIEFVKGEDFFLTFSGNENFGWEGVLLDRKVLNSLKVFESTYSGFDKSSNLALLLYGNICLIDKICYSFIVHSNSYSHNPTAQSSLDNFLMVEFPYQRAIRVGKIEKSTLDSWRNTFIFNLSVKAARALYIRDKDEYHSFIGRVQSEYGINGKDLKKGIKVRLDYMLYYFPFLGKLLVASWKNIEKLINSFRSKR